MTRRQKIAALMGFVTVAAVGAGVVFTQVPWRLNPMFTAFNPASIAVAVVNRATVDISWRQPMDSDHFPTTYNQVKVYEPCQYKTRDGGVDTQLKDGGPAWGCPGTWACLHTDQRDSGAWPTETQVPDGGCYGGRDAGVHRPRVDGGGDDGGYATINWDAGTPVCFCNRDGGVRDSGSPGTWDDHFSPNLTLSLCPGYGVRLDGGLLDGGAPRLPGECPATRTDAGVFEVENPGPVTGPRLIPCPTAPGTACPTGWSH